jgi:hypothetical protein
MDSSTMWRTDTCASLQDPSGGAHVWVCVRACLGCVVDMLIEGVWGVCLLAVHSCV